MTNAEIFAALRLGDVSFFEGHPDQIDLRNLGATTNSQTEWDELTALHVAAKHGQLDAVRRLVALGAEVYSNPLATYPAVLVADWAQQGQVVDYFLNEIPEKAIGTRDVGITCNLAGRQGWYDRVQMHVDRDPLVVHQRGWIGDTPLHWPAHNGYLEIVRLLLSHGADPNAEENNWIGGTPLHWASERHAEIIKLLVEAGANPNFQVTRPGSDHLGGTPLHWCARQRDDSAVAAEALLHAGTDPTILDAFGKSALDYAGPNVRAVLIG